MNILKIHDIDLSNYSVIKSHACGGLLFDIYKEYKCQYILVKFKDFDKKNICNIESLYIINNINHENLWRFYRFIRTIDYGCTFLNKNWKIYKTNLEDNPTRFDDFVYRDITMQISKLSKHALRFDMLF